MPTKLNEWLTVCICPDRLIGLPSLSLARGMQHEPWNAAAGTRVFGYNQ